jgi:hypothetical protein
MEILMQKLMILAGTAAFALSLGAPTAQAAVSKPHSAISLECSKEADAKGLHGKTRKHFRAKCKREAEKSATAGTTGTTGWKSKYDSMKGYRAPNSSAGMN